MEEWRNGGMEEWKLFDFRCDDQSTMYDNNMVWYQYWYLVPAGTIPGIYCT
jgi:hypothetical protein